MPLDNATKSFVDSCLTLAADVFDTCMASKDPHDHIYWMLSHGLNLCCHLRQLKCDWPIKKCSMLQNTVSQLHCFSAKCTDKLLTASQPEAATNMTEIAACLTSLIMSLDWA